MTPARQPRFPPVALADARNALQVVVPRLTALVRGAGSADAIALGTWSVADLATHLTHVFSAVPGLASGKSASPLAKFSDLGEFTQDFVKAEPERDLGKLADRIDVSFRRFMELTDPMAGSEVRPWLVEGLTADVRTLHCHILNEVIVHGFDIARASGQPWPVDPAAARLVLEGFIVPVIGMLGPRSLVDQQKAAGLKACYDIRLRGGGRVFFFFDDGALTPEPPSSRPVDCHISADPAELLLVVWRRKSQWGPIGRFKMTAWGRRPWLAFKLTSLLKNP